MNRAGAPKFHYADLADVLASATEAFSSLQHFCSRAEPSWSLCSSHAHENFQAPSYLSVGFLCSSCGQFCGSEGAPVLAVSEHCLATQNHSEEFTQVLY